MSKKNEEKLIIDEEISEEGVDFQTLESDDDILSSVEEAKIAENISTVNADDSVRIYLQQIGKIPLLAGSEEFEIAKKIKDENCGLSKKILVNANLRDRKSVV